MATPIISSEIYLLPDPDPIPTRTRIRKLDRKELWFKIFQLVLQSFQIALYSFGTQQATILPGDTIFAAFFGASVLFIIWKIIDAANQSHRNKVFFNITFGVVLIIIALILIPLIMMLQDSVPKTDEYEKTIFYISIKLYSGIMCFILGVMCFAEAIYATLNNVNVNEILV